MALGLFTATADTGSGFFLVNFFFSTVYLAINKLECEHVSSQLMAQGLLRATAGIGSCFVLVKLFFSM
jgi:hypothetical protein